MWNQNSDRAIATKLSIRQATFKVINRGIPIDNWNRTAALRYATESFSIPLHFFFPIVRIFEGGTSRPRDDGMQQTTYLLIAPYFFLSKVQEPRTEPRPTAWNKQYFLLNSPSASRKLASGLNPPRTCGTQQQSVLHLCALTQRKLGL